MIELIDREAALDAIKFSELGCEYDEVEKVQIFNPWHRVEEEMPYENTNALFYDENGYFHVGFMSRFRGYTEFIDFDGNALHGITHWMPIEPPKEDE